MSDMDDLEYEELIVQPYRDCAFSAGCVTGHPVDTLYLRLARDGEEPTTILLRPDEAAALAWCLTGVLWSDRMRLDGHSPASAAARHVFVETTSSHGELPEGARKYIRDVPPITTVIHKGLPLAFDSTSHQAPAAPAEAGGA